MIEICGFYINAASCLILELNGVGLSFHTSLVRMDKITVFEINFHNVIKKDFDIRSYIGIKSINKIKKY